MTKVEESVKPSVLFSNKKNIIALVMKSLPSIPEEQSQPIFKKLKELLVVVIGVEGEGAAKKVGGEEEEGESEGYLSHSRELSLNFLAVVEATLHVAERIGLPEVIDTSEAILKRLRALHATFSDVAQEIIDVVRRFRYENASE